MTNVNVREIVLDMLLDITREGKYSHLVLQQTLSKYQYLDKQQRSFLSRVTHGTVEHMIELDYIINSYSKTPVKKMKPLIRNLLRMSVYQLKYMDAVPDSAVCNEAVKLANKRGFSQLKGFVNGVLRNIARNIGEIEYPDLSVKYSMPQWIVAMWEKEYGKARTEEILQAFYQEARTCIRTNLSRISGAELRLRLEKEGVTVYPVPEVDYAFFIDDYDYLMALPSFQKGLFYVQDISSMMVAERAGIQPGDICLDVCAAPGGKSLHMAELLQGTGKVEARDVSDYKVGFINENIVKSGLNNITAKKWDATIPDPEWTEKADIVIADLPCSGLGVIGKKPDIKLHATPESLQELAVLQQSILQVVCAYVKPGGRMVFSTCTINRQENEENVAKFLQTHKEFQCISMEQLLPKAGADTDTVSVSDGFFISVLQKE